MGSAHLLVVQRIADPRGSRIVCRPSKLALQWMQRRHIEVGAVGGLEWAVQTR